MKKYNYFDDEADEIEEVKKYFLKKIHDAVYHEEEIKVIELAGLVEISIPKHHLDTEFAM